MHAIKNESRVARSDIREPSSIGAPSWRTRPVGGGIALVSGTLIRCHEPFRSAGVCGHHIDAVVCMPIRVLSSFADKGEVVSIGRPRRLDGIVGPGGQRRYMAGFSIQQLQLQMLASEVTRYVLLEVKAID